MELVDDTGLHVVVPPMGSRENHEDFPPGSGKDFSGPDTMIERFVVHKSLLDIPCELTGGIYRFRSGH